MGFPNYIIECLPSELSKECLTPAEGSACAQDGFTPAALTHTTLTHTPACWDSQTQAFTETDILQVPRKHACMCTHTHTHPTAHNVHPTHRLTTCTRTYIPHALTQPSRAATPGRLLFLISHGHLQGDSCRLILGRVSSRMLSLSMPWKVAAARPLQAPWPQF